MGYIYGPLTALCNGGIQSLAGLLIARDSKIQIEICRKTGRFAFAALRHGGCACFASEKGGYTSRYNIRVLGGLTAHFLWRPQFPLKRAKKTYKKGKKVIMQMLKNLVYL